MTTQTLQDIIGKEPHHWRGDRDGLEEFNETFVGLLGDDRQLTHEEMQEFEDYLATIHFPPNPYRNLDNTLPEDLPLPGHYTNDRFGTEGRPMPNGNAKRALDTLYRPISRGIDRNALACVSCHALPTGIGPDARATLLGFQSIPAGPEGERHHALISLDGSSQHTIKTAQLRNLYDKVGFEMTQKKSRAGFGYLHDGSVDSLTRFFSEPAFAPEGDQEVADLVALMLAFTGSEFGEPADFLEPPGTASQDVPAAVGKQATWLPGANQNGAPLSTLNELEALADKGQIDLILKTNIDGRERGALYTGDGTYQSDRADSTLSFLELEQIAATSGIPLTFTAVAKGTGARLGIDRDCDGIGDFDETRDLAPEVPGFQNPFSVLSSDATGDAGSLEPDGIPDGDNDFDDDGTSNSAELAAGTNPVENLGAEPPLVITTVSVVDGTGAVSLQWTATPGAVYAVQYSDNLFQWLLAGGGEITAGPEDTTLQWEDNGEPATAEPPANATRRYYRVRRVR